MARIRDGHDRERRRRLVRDGRARSASSTASSPIPAEWEQVTDILDVWFDFRLDARLHAGGPGAFPGLAGIKRRRDGGKDRVMYLEGSDQHRGWFQSSLLESCGTRGRAPFDVVLTHGFVLDEKGQKMSKSLGNTVAPAGRDQEFRRRHPAPVGGGVRLRRRPAHRPGDPEERSSRPIASCATRCAGCWARSAHYDPKQTRAAEGHAASWSG